MQVRLAELSDLEQVKDVMQLVYRSFGEWVPRDDLLGEFIGAALADRQRLRFVVAEEEGELLGMLSLAFCPTTLRVASFAYVDDFHVREESRGRGVGKALLRFAKEHAREAGAVELKLTASTADPRLAKLYREMGFEPSPLPLFILPLDVPEGGSAA